LRVEFKRKAVVNFDQYKAPIAKNIPHRGRAGLERAQRELSVIEAQLRLRGLLE